MKDRGDGDPPPRFLFTVFNPFLSGYALCMEICLILVERGV